jgi:hypothetical protein
MPVPTLSDAKEHLNVSGSSQDNNILAYLKAAQNLIDARVGSSSVKTYAEQVMTHAPAMCVSWRPVKSIVSLIPNINTWPSFASSDVSYDARSGVIWRNDLGTLAGSYTANYTAGWTPDEYQDNWYLAVLITLQHLYRTQRGGSRRPNQGGTDDLNVHVGSFMTRTLLGGSITLPAAALELIQDGIYFGGVA